MCGLILLVCVCLVVCVEQHVNMDRFDLNLLAQISEGYTGGAIQSAIKRTLTPRRQEKLERQPLQEVGACGRAQTSLG